jgi:hypothetical protein
MNAKYSMHIFGSHCGLEKREQQKTITAEFNFHDFFRLIGSNIITELFLPLAFFTCTSHILEGLEVVVD